jgi:predicted lipoprotein with Yx(FWY)xxD motif
MGVGHSENWHEIKRAPVVSDWVIDVPVKSHSKNKLSTRHVSVRVAPENRQLIKLHSDKLASVKSVFVKSICAKTWPSHDAARADKCDGDRGAVFGNVIVCSPGSG